MGRELRMVTPAWEHPKDTSGRYVALLNGDHYLPEKEEFEKAVLERGYQGAVDWCGQDPNINDYMLVGVPIEMRTKYMMYECTSEGTPISPAFDTPEELARWLADTKASAFAGDPASYEAWLNTIRVGSAPSAYFQEGKEMVSGVEGTYQYDKAKSEDNNARIF